jgi:hypothetical protein
MKSGIIFIGVLLFIFGFGFSSQSQKQNPNSQQQIKIPVNFCISPVEVELFNMINQYRKLYNLPPIPLSRSLSYVAKTHVRDLFFNRPDQGSCNFHSWSDKGKWKPFCYPKDEKKNFSVWDKPKEITPYKSKGYEIVYWENNPVTIDSILPFWRSIDYFNSFLIYTGKWQGKTWLAIGIGIYENYAAVWFGEIPDPEGEPWICGQEKEKKIIIDEPRTDSLTPSAEPVESQPKTEVKEVIPESPGTYYIIVSSQQPRTKSNQLASELLVKGYKEAKVLVKGNKVRVSIMEVNKKAEADSALREVKKIYKEAWIYRQNNP